jgi:hypothetical protein
VYSKCGPFFTTSVYFDSYPITSIMAHATLSSKVWASNRNIHRGSFSRGVKTNRNIYSTIYLTSARSFTSLMGPYDPIYVLIDSSLACPRPGASPQQSQPRSTHPFAKLVRRKTLHTLNRVSLIRYFSGRP